MSAAGDESQGGRGMSAAGQVRTLPRQATGQKEAEG